MWKITADTVIMDEDDNLVIKEHFGAIMRRIVIGILAHVDAGKTTLSEGLLYACHIVRKLGRVDKKDSFLDNYALERERGITIYSKQAVFCYGDVSFTLLDTPGHVDFSPEMERTLCMLDAAILVINGAEGVQAHTRTLWKLLQAYDVPTFIFVNKMDREICLKDNIYREIRNHLSKSCVDISDLFQNGPENKKNSDTVLENIALCDEAVLEEYLETGLVSDERIRELVGNREIFPTLFGSALCLRGIEELLQALQRFIPPVFPEEKFAARIYKITRDESGKRLTHMKITGGMLKSRDILNYSAMINTGGAAEKPDSTGGENDICENESGKMLSEKITEIRIYNGEKYESVDRAEQGMVVAVAGLSCTAAGGVLGDEDELPEKQLTPVLTYRVVGKDRSELGALLPKFRLMEEEEPQLHVVWNPEVKELQVHIMGEIQLEILKSRFRERFNEQIEFDKGSILYRETVSAPVLGVGHYEPLRHYAEVQLIIEPAKPGSGISFRSACSVDELDKNWQRLIMTHIYEKEHKGCRIGAVLDDVCITLVAGRAHIKHTEGGDFRQATYRAVRQGLMRALSSGNAVILEPYYEFTLEIPRSCIGRAMTDIEMRSGQVTGQYETAMDGSSDASADMVVLTGHAPVSSMQGYVKEVTVYTKGLGALSCAYYGYLPCHNQDEVTAAAGYDALSDMRNPSYSVFCARGAGFPVEWDRVDEYKHTECKISFDNNGSMNSWEKIAEEEKTDSVNAPLEDVFVTTEEIDSIINRTFYANRKEGYKNPFRKARARIANDSTKNGNTVTDSRYQAGPQKDKYLLVDGYNIIFAWDELRELAAANIDGARERLNEILCNFQAVHDYNLIVVYDAYRIEGHRTEFFKLRNINVVYTREAEIADRYIERFVHENAKKYDITVATSDGLEQIIIRGQGAMLWSARDFLDEVRRTESGIRERITAGNEKIGTSLNDMPLLKQTR